MSGADHPPRMGELFAGYGGLGMAVEQAIGPVQRMWVSEFDPAPSRILEHHWPDVPNLGDVTKIDWAQVPRVDVLTGGFPCQDVSIAGAQAGMGEGTRSGLWSYFAEAIRVLRPGLVVIENVRGLLSAHAGRGTDVDVEFCPVCVGDGAGDDLRALGAVLGDLADLGFDAEWGVLEASAVGAPHRRARVFIIAWPTTDPGSDEPERGGVGGVMGGAPSAGEGSGGQRERVWDAVVDRDSEARLMPTPRASRGASATETVKVLPTPDAALAGRGGASDPVKRRAGGHAVSLADTVHVLPTPTASDASASGGSSPSSVTLTDAAIGRRGLTEGVAAPLAHAQFGEFAPAVDRWEAVLGRPVPAPTEPGPKCGSRISPRFVEWMMGLPDGHVTGVGLSRVQELKALGNGVVPQQGAAAVRGLLGRVS